MPEAVIIPGLERRNRHADPAREAVLVHAVPPAGPDLCVGVIRVVTRALKRWYRQRAADRGHPGGECGAVTAIQRFSSSLSLNVHLHMLWLDGVYVEGTDAEAGPRFVRSGAPSTEEVAAVVASVAERVERWLAKQGFGDDDRCEPDDGEDDGQAVLLAASVAGRVAHGTRAGRKVRRLVGLDERPFRHPPRCAEAAGYNLHAGVVVGAGDAGGRERLCRYVCRPPLARSRLSRRDDGLLKLALRRPWANGTPSILFSEVELVEKLLALGPPPNRNQLVYAGVFAARHRWRAASFHRPSARPRAALSASAAPRAGPTGGTRGPI